MNKKKIYGLVFSIVALICIGCFIWSWFVTRGIRNKVEENFSKGQQVIVKNLVLTETKDGNVFWQLYAKSGEYESNTGLVILKNIIGNFYNEKNEVVLSFESPQGSYKEANKAIVLDGETLIVAQDGSSIMANKIIFKGKDDDIVASGNVRINRNNELITHSEKATFNSELTYFRIDGKSKVKIYDNKPQLNKKEGLLKPSEGKKQ